MRFWIAVSLLACVNLIGWMVDWRAVFPARADIALRVETQSDDGEWLGDTTASGCELVVQSDRAMHAAAGATASFSPPIPGSWSWRSDRELVFRSSAPLAQATRYRLTIAADGVVAADGTRLRSAWTADLHTTPLRVLSLRAVDRLSDGAHVLQMRFNHPVVPAQIAAALSVRHLGSASDAIAVHAQGDAIGTVVSLMTARMPSSGLSIEATLRAGVTSTAGPLGLENAFVQRLTLTPELRCTQIAFRNRDWRDDQQDLILEFNRAVDVASVRAALRLDPPVAVQIRGEDGARVVCSGPFAPSTTYDIHLATTSTAARVPRPERISLRTPDQQPSCRFNETQGRLGSAGNRSVLITVANLSAVRIDLRRLHDNNIAAWRTTRRIGALSMPIASRVFAINPGDTSKKRSVEQRIELDALLGTRAEDGVYALSMSNADTSTPTRGRYYYSSSDDMLVSLSDVALSARLSQSQGKHHVLVWATSLASGRPLANLDVQLISQALQPLQPRGATSASVRTDEHGLAMLSDVICNPEDAPAVIIARAADGRAVSWLDLHQRPLSDPLSDIGGRPWREVEAFVYPDRGLIRPGERMHWRAIVRGRNGDVPPPHPVRWLVRRPDGRDFLQRMHTLDRDGCASLDLDLPDTAMTGDWRVQLDIPGERAKSGSSDMASTVLGSAGFLAEDFIPERLAVNIDIPKHLTAFADAATASSAQIQARWLFGDHAAGLRASWQQRLDPIANDAGPGWEAGDACQLAPLVGLDGDIAGLRVDERNATLDAQGRANIPLRLSELLNTHAARIAARPWRMTGIAGVSEAGGRTISQSVSARVDPVAQYLCVRAQRDTLDASCRVDLRLIDHAGATATTAATRTAQVRVWRARWETTVSREAGRYQYRSHRELTPVSATMSVQLRNGEGSVLCPLNDDDADDVLILAHIPDSTLAVSTALRSAASAWSGTVDRERPERIALSIVSGTAPAIVGDDIEVDVRSPFPGTLLLCVEGERVLAKQVQHMTVNSGRFRIAGNPQWGSSFHITATVLRGVDPSIAWRVVRGFGCARVQLHQPARSAVVRIEAPESVRPGATCPIQVQLHDESGQPLRDAAITIAVVDEGALRPIAFATPNPQAFFNAPRRLATIAIDMFADLLREAPPSVGTATTGGDGHDMGRHRPPTPMQRVRTLALWSGVLRSDDAGNARFDCAIPSSFTGRVRIMAVAAHYTRSGSAERALRVRAPLMISSSVPRFLAPGDRCRIPVTVFAAPSSSAAVLLSWSFAGRSATRSLDAAASDSVTTLIDLDAPDACGTSELRISASRADDVAEERTPIPVRIGHGLSTLSGVALLRPGASVAIQIPAFQHGIYDATVTIDTLPQAMPAQQRLIAYPHGCAEQTISGCLAVLTMPCDDDARRASLRARLDAGFARLRLMSTSDNGLAMWPDGRESWPWASVMALHLCALSATIMPDAVPADLRDQLIAYARSIVHRSNADELPTRCYAAWMLALHDRLPPGVLERLAIDATKEHIAPECRLHLACAWLALGETQRGLALIPDGIAVRTQTTRNSTIGTPLRDRAMLLMALSASNREDPRMLRLALELANDASARSTQDDAWVSLALHAARSRLAPTTLAQAQLLVLGTAKPLASSTQALRWTGTPPPDGMLAAIDGNASAVAYLAWSISGISATPPASASRGLIARRSYSKPPAQWRRGDLIEVTISVDGAGLSHQHVVIEDLLPAACEIENPRLLTSAAHDESARAHDEAQRIERRDDRLVLVTDIASFATWQHRYQLRVVAAGDVAIPALTAECMYDRSIFAVSDHVPRVHIPER